VTSGFITSTVLFGAMLGSLCGGFLSNFFGMKFTAFLGASICLFGATTSAFSISLPIWMACRVVLGIGIGLIGVICPLYVSIMAPKHLKGPFGVLFQLTLTFGILIAYVVGYGCTKVGDIFLSWRIMVGSGGALSAILLQLVVYFGMVEPPKTVKMIDESEPLNPNSNGKPSFLTLFKSGRRLNTLTGIMLAITLQLTGINAIMYFGPKILKSAGLDEAVALNIGIGAWNFVTTFLAILLVNRVSSRVLVVVGTSVMSVALVICGICMDGSIVSNPTYKGVGVGIGLILFLAGFEGGMGCLFWVLVNEIFDSDVREYGASMTNLLQWGFNLLLSTFFLSISKTIGDDKTFYVFGGIGVLCSIYLIFFLKKLEKDF